MSETPQFWTNVYLFLSTQRYRTVAGSLMEMKSRHIAFAANRICPLQAAGKEFPARDSPARCIVGGWPLAAMFQGSLAPLYIRVSYQRRSGHKGNKAQEGNHPLTPHPPPERSREAQVPQTLRPVKREASPGVSADQRFPKCPAFSISPARTECDGKTRDTHIRGVRSAWHDHVQGRRSRSRDRERPRTGVTCSDGASALRSSTSCPHLQ